MGWDRLAGTGVATAQKIVQRPTPFLTQHSASPVGRGYSNEQSPPRSRAYRRIHTDRSDPITNTIFMKCTGDHQESLPNKDLVFGKIKDAISPSQPVGAWVEKTECNARCNEPATAGGRARFQVPGQIFEIDAGGDGSLVPWVKEKATWLKFIHLKTKENFLPSILAGQ